VRLIPGHDVESAGVREHGLRKAYKYQLSGGLPPQTGCPLARGRLGGCTAAKVTLHIVSGTRRARLLGRGAPFALQSDSVNPVSGQPLQNK
jgi:hypothetical protein